MGRRFESCRAHHFLPSCGFAGHSQILCVGLFFRANSRPEKIKLEGSHLPSRLQTLVLNCILLVGCACSRVPNGGSQPFSAIGEPTTLALAADSSRESLSSLLNHIWRVTKSPAQPAAGSIYIFVANGTLLETSCVETYRIAAWTIDKSSPQELRVVEDRQLAFTANITKLTNTTLRLQQHLVRRKETRDLTLTAVEGELVCPDLSK
jgi:hypothetical protein